MRCILIFPELCAKTMCPFSSSTLNMALGSGSTTVPSRTIASSLAFGRVNTPWGRMFRRLVRLEHQASGGRLDVLARQARADPRC